VSSRPSDGSGGSSGRKPKGQPIVSPVTVEKMPVLVDRLTVKNMLERREGLINVNTAPAEVLATLSALTEEEIQAIITRRMQLSGEEKRTIAWLVTAGVLSPEKFMLISNDITARTIQYAADVIGFADHTGTSRRIQAIIEMQGHFAQIKYYRDISALGIGFPVWDDQRSEGFAFDAP